MHNKHSIVRVKKGKKKRTAVCQSKNIDSPPSNRLISLEKEKKKKRQTKKRRFRSSQMFVSSLIEVCKANQVKVQYTTKRKVAVPYA